MTLPEHCDDDIRVPAPRDRQGQSSSNMTSGSNAGKGLSSSIAATPRDIRASGYRNRSVMSDVLPDSRLSFLPIIRRSSMASSVASSIKSSSLYSTSTGSNSPMSGPPTGFSSPAKMIHLPKLLLRELQPGYFDVQDEMIFNRAMRLPELDQSPTDCRLNLVAQKLQEGSNSNESYEQREPATLPVPEFRDARGSRESEREAAPKRKRRRNRKRSEQRQKNVEVERNED